MCKEKKTNFSVADSKCMIDLHLHLDGAMSLNTAKQLANLQGIKLPDSDEEIMKKLKVSGKCCSLKEFLEKFDFPCSLLAPPERIKIAVANLINEAAINAAGNNRAYIKQSDIERAFIKIGIGEEKKSNKKKKHMSMNYIVKIITFLKKIWMTIIKKCAPFLKKKVIIIPTKA